MRGVVGVAVSLLFALGACGSEDSSDVVVYELAELRERPAGMLSWQPCGAVECATLEVPIDREDPSLGSLSLALNRVRASEAAGYRGVVLVNPGGPGASGTAYVAGSAGGLRAFLPGFDFIGFDPRGIGDSGGLDCELSDSALLEGLIAEDSAGYLRELERASVECAARVGPLFEHLGSNQVVADIESIRQALGEEQINFIGISYGTRLGALYARTYREHARAVVLDGPLPPVADIRRQTESQFAALLELQQEFFEDCEAAVLRCPPQPRAVFDAVAADANRSPLLQAAFANWKFLLGSAPGRELAALSLRVYAGEEPPPEMMAGMMAAADVLPDFNRAANLTTNCADDSSRRLTPAQGDQLLFTYLQRSQVFARESLSALSCSGWQVPRDPLPSLRFEPRVPPLVIGGTRDILTPYELAQEAAVALEGAALLTSEHYGHSALNLGLPSCVLGHVRRYLETLELPPEGSRCEPPPAP